MVLQARAAWRARFYAMGEPFGAGFCAARGFGGGVIYLGGGGRVRLPLPAMAPSFVGGYAAPIGL